VLNLLVRSVVVPSFRGLILRNIFTFVSKVAFVIVLDSFLLLLRLIELFSQREAIVFTFDNNFLLLLLSLRGNGLLLRLLDFSFAIHFQFNRFSVRRTSGFRSVNEGVEMLPHSKMVPLRLMN